MSPNRANKWSMLAGASLLTAVSGMAMPAAAADEPGAADVEKRHEQQMSQGKAHEEALRATGVPKTHDDQSNAEAKEVADIEKRHEQQMAQGKAHEEALRATGMPKMKHKKPAAAGKKHEQQMSQGKAHEDAKRATESSQ